MARRQTQRQVRKLLITLQANTRPSQEAIVLRTMTFGWDLRQHLLSSG